MTSSAPTMAGSTSLNASAELARAIAFMQTILRTGPVIASARDDQRYALVDGRGGPARRWSAHATLPIRNADQPSVTAVGAYRLIASSICGSTDARPCSADATVLTRLPRAPRRCR